MRRLNAFISGAIVATGVTIMTTVAYADFASVKELCSSQWSNFQVIRSMSGLTAPTDEQFSMFNKAAQSIVDAETVRQNKFNVDKNYRNVSTEVAFHAGETVKAAQVKDQEEIQVQYRWLTISCKNCHRMYRTDEKLAP